MATMLAEVYDAFREAGASEEKSRAAATAVAAYDQRFNRIETELAVVKWMVGANIALTLSLVAKTFF